MNLAVIGSRTFLNRELLAETLSKVQTPITCIVSGGARGADSIAAEWAHARGIPVREFLPDYNLHGKQAPLLRNKEIVDFADNVLAFHDGVSRGTMHAIDHAKRLNKPFHIITFTP